MRYEPHPFQSAIGRSVIGVCRRCFIRGLGWRRFALSLFRGLFFGRFLLRSLFFSRFFPGRFLALHFLRRLSLGRWFLRWLGFYRRFGRLDNRRNHGCRRGSRCRRWSRLYSFLYRSRCRGRFFTATEHAREETWLASLRLGRFSRFVGGTAEQVAEKTCHRTSAKQGPVLSAVQP